MSATREGPTPGSHGVREAGMVSPQNRLALRAASRADDAGFRALHDISRLGREMAAEYRVVGGQMTSLLVAAYGATNAPQRSTADADLGTSHQVIAQPALLSKLAELGYQERTSSNTFVRRFDDDTTAVIDVLGPSGTTRLEQATAGEVSYDAIPGLQVALARAAVELHIDAQLTDGSELAMDLQLPDPVSALVLKTLSWASRMAEKDAVDVWRLLEVCLVAGVEPTDFTFGAKRDAVRVLRQHFSHPAGAGVRRFRPGTINRVTALVAKIVGREPAKQPS